VDASDGASFGELLKTYRERARLSQSELAARAGLSRRGISDLERGERRAPQRETTRRLIEALELSDQQQSRFVMAAREGHFQAPPVSRLPLALTTFIGREHELDDVLKLLQTTRLLTVTGTGGIGKTRLALDVASRTQAEYEDGVGLVDLSALTDSTQVPHSVAAAFGVREQPGQSIATLLVDFLEDRRVLVVLDNCEHLLNACAALSEHLLRTCAGLDILATSREALGVTAETRWSLPPMHVPPTEAARPSDVAASESVQLFYERARAVQPTFRHSAENDRAVAEICRRLDGLPLAIELAAAWIAVLPADEIAHRLNSRLELAGRGSRMAQPRQQTLRASLDWSYELLSGLEAVVFTRLAVFAGGWRLEAAEAVCADNAIPMEDVLGCLGRLVDKSLVQVEPARSGVRYKFLETVRQYAYERLQASGDAEHVSAGHAAYFVNLAAQATSELSGPPDASRHVDLESEHDNLRATVRWVIGHREVQAAHTLGTALARFSQIGNHLTEGRGWLAEILALADEPSVGRARTLVGAGLLGAYQGDYTFAVECLIEGVGICRSLGEDRELAHGLFALGLMAWTRGDYAAARAWGDEGLIVSRRAPHRGFEALHLFILSAAAAEAGEIANARSLAEQCRSLATRANFGRAIGLSLGVLGLLSYDEGDYATADSLLMQAVEQLESAGIPVAVAWALSLRARVRLAQGDTAGAQLLCAESLRLVKAFNLRGRVPFVIDTLASVLAYAAPEQALLLAGAAQSIRQQLGVAIAPAELARVTEWLEPLRASVGLRPADEWWTRGATLSLDEALETALDLSSAHRWGP
jgi:non-specific serine/threonine protein kinase